MFTANDKLMNKREWEVLYPVSTCSLTEAEEGANTAQMTSCGLPPPWYCLTEASSSVEKEQAASPAHLLCTIEVVAVHRGWPSLWLISTTLCNSKKICIWDVVQW